MKPNGKCWTCGKDLQPYASSVGDVWKRLFCDNECNLAYCLGKVRLAANEGIDRAAEYLKREPSVNLEQAQAEMRERQAEQPRRGRKPGAAYKNEEWAVAKAALISGKSVRETARMSGLCTTTVNKIRRQIAAELPTTCDCGRAFGHRGWCPTRLAKSPARQETVKMLTGQLPPVPVIRAKDVRCDPVKRVQRQIVKAEAKTTPQHRMVINLESGGTLELAINVSLLHVGKTERDFVFQVVDLLKSYE